MPHRLLGVPANGMIDGFRAALTERGITADAAQLAAATRLQVFYDELVAFKAARRTALRKLLVHPKLPRGVWFWGGVGRGKSFLMDCFFAAVPYRRKRRVHFHAFMQEVQQSLASQRNQSDALGKVAEQIASETRLMCFDEFHVADIADAMILGRLMDALFDAGVLFCITSNYAPDHLYPNGLHRDRFLPAIDLLKRHLDIIEVDGGIDYRLRDLAIEQVYLVPNNAQKLAQMEALFCRVAQGEGHSRPIEIAGREIPVIQRAPGVLWFDFATLCGGPRGQSDYLAIADRHHTVFLSGVPRLGVGQANEARRFTWLVDIFYDHNVKLVIGADTEAESLYLQGQHANEFARTVSRLIEMRSNEYLQRPHRRDDHPTTWGDD